MQDVERQRTDKVRQVSAALKEGKLPTTAQAMSAIDKLQQSSLDADLSLTGQKVAQDAQKLLQDTKNMMGQTMPNNELQQALYYGAQAARRTDMSSQEASQAADQLVQAGATAAQLARIIVTSPEFRSLLSDLSSIAQDIVRSNVDEATDDLANDPNVPQQVRDAAQKTRDTIRSNDNDLQGATQQAADQAKGKFEQGKQQARETVDDASRRAQEAGSETRRAGGESLAQGNTLRDTAKQVVDTIADQAERHLPQDTVDKTSSTLREHGAKLHTGQESASGLKNQAISQGKSATEQGKQMANQALSQLRDPTSQVRQTGERVARKLVDLPPDQRDDIVKRVKSAARTIQSKPEFQRGIDDLIDLLAPLGWQAKAAADSAITTTSTTLAEGELAPSSREARIAAKNAKQLVENFASGRSLDPLIQTIQSFAQEARGDQELMAFWKDVGNYINQTVRDPSFIQQTNYDRDVEQLVERGRRALDGYSYYTQQIAYEGRTFANALAQNRSTQRLQSDANALVKDLFLDERGKPTFKPELLADLAKCIPAIADKLAYLPIPRIEVDDGTYHLIFDNIILHSTILPKYVHVVTDTTVDATKQDPAAQFNNYILLEISNIEASARDIAWLYNKHAGFWKAGDVGLADFDVKGQGVSVRCKIIPGSETGPAAPGKEVRGRYLHAAEIETTVHNLDLRLHDSHHDFLYKIVKPILQTRARKQIEKSISDVLRDMIFNLDESVASAAGTAPPPVAYQDPKEGVPEWGSKAFNT